MINNNPWWSFTVQEKYIKTYYFDKNNDKESGQT